MKSSVIKQNVGIDIAKDDFQVCFCQINEELITSVTGSRKFSNDLAGFVDFLSWSEKRHQLPVSLSFTMEATGVYYENLAYYLVERGYVVYVVLPNQAKKFVQSMGLKSKTDEIDARCLGSMGLERKLQQWKPFSAHFMALKHLTRERETLIYNRTCALNRLHAHTYQAHPQPETVERTRSLIAFYTSQVDEIEQEMKALVKSDDALCERLSYVESIKGTGFITAVTILAETNGFATFTSIKQLTSFAGLDIRIAQSGSWKGKSRISKQGNSHIRRALYFPAFSMIKHNERTGNFYERLLQRKGCKMVAAVAVQRKLLGLMYTLWKKQEIFKDTPEEISGNVEHKSSFGLPEGQKKVVGDRVPTTQDRHPYNVVTRSLPSAATKVAKTKE